MAVALNRLRRSNIDDERWDAAVLSDPSPLPYALSWWLDAVTGGDWSGLVLDDYRVVLPLPYARKFGVLRLIYRPPFSQQLGPYGEVRTGDLAQLLSSISKGLKFSLPLRSGADRVEIPPAFSVRERTNFVLDLDRSYAKIEAAISTNLRRSIRRAEKAELSKATRETLIDLCRETLVARGALQEQQLTILHQLISRAEERNAGHCYQLKESGQLLAAGFYPKLNGRIINLSAASSAIGTEREGMGRMLAAIIAQNVGPGRVFDFEGSDLPGVQAFFRKFRPRNEGYLQLS